MIICVTGKNRYDIMYNIKSIRAFHTTKNELLFLIETNVARFLFSERHRRSARGNAFGIKNGYRPTGSRTRIRGTGHHENVANIRAITTNN